MNHQIRKEQISQLLDNELPQESLQPLFQHLGECGECRSFFMQTKSIHDNMKMLDYTTVPDVLDQKFAVLGMDIKTPFFARTFSLSVPAAVLSAFLVVITSMLLFFAVSTSESSTYTQRMDEQMTPLFSTYGRLPVR